MSANLNNVFLWNQAKLLYDIFGDVFEYVSTWALVICLLQTICV